MKDMTLNGDQSGLTRRQLLGLATLTTAGLAAASVGVPQAKAVPKAGEQHEPIEDFKHDLEGSEGWVGEGGSAKESTVKQLPVATSIAGVSMRFDVVDQKSALTSSAPVWLPERHSRWLQIRR